MDCQESAMKHVLNEFVSTPMGAFVVLVMAASLEVLGDSFFQSGLYRSGGAARWGWFGAGVAVLAMYGFSVNLPQWDFGRLLGAYVALFFVVAQVVAKVRFQQSPSAGIWVGGGLIVAGGMVITFWKP
jgi:drug/metabolite transporter superfamily protein YnfA